MRGFLQQVGAAVIGLSVLLCFGAIVGCGSGARATVSALTIIHPDVVEVASSRPAPAVSSEFLAEIAAGVPANAYPEPDSAPRPEPVPARFVDASLAIYHRDRTLPISEPGPTAEAGPVAEAERVSEPFPITEHGPILEPEPIAEPGPMPQPRNGPSPKPPEKSPYLATITVGSTKGRAISPTFMGLSHEWGVQAQMGTAATGVDKIYRQLLKNLMAYGSGPLILRIGGNSTDKTGEPTATTVQAFSELATAMNVRFYLGVNLGADNVKLAVDQAKAYVRQMPAGSLEAIEIGNEPDDYVQHGMRSAPYTFQNYLAEFDTWKKSIAPILPSNIRLMGASWSWSGPLSNLQPYLADESSDLGTFSVHGYLGSLKTLPAEDVLLTPIVATKGPQSVAAAVTATHSVGLPFRMGEIGAFDDPTSTSVNNDFEAALWAIDIMFEYANVGVDGVNWHGNPGATATYTSFNIARKTTGATTAYSLLTVRPLYYGLLFFQQATGRSAHLLPVTLTTSANLKAWATADASGTPRLVIINKDESNAGTVSVLMPGYTHAKLLSLTAPTYLSTTGVTFAGQTFDGSPDGTIQGTQSVENFGSTDSVFKIPMPITSAALVVFSK